MLGSATRQGFGMVAALLLAACGGTAPPPPATDGPPPGEQLLLAPATVADLKDVAAEITTRDRAEAMPRIPGTLASLDVRAGDRVRKGQRIGLVVDQRVGFEAGAAEAAVAAAQAAAAQANADLTRIRQLYERKVYAQARLDQAVAAASAADAQLAAARARQSASASVVSQGAILAPESGRVLRADVPAGSVVAPGLSIASIAAGPVILRLDLPESLGRQVKPGASVLLDDGRRAEVTQIYPGVSAGRVRVDASAAGLDDMLVGRRVSARVEAGERQALLVPKRFVATRYGIDTVRILGRDRQPATVPVQTAPTGDPEMLELLSGAGAGDTLFRAGDAE